eukprot:GHVU01003486.1.p1 GENE.GHVU01003486.1~~GHVU01003486.1.p1  ORF type:complete len:199 (+),score=4.45 GHVU01003486.1:149-745(+)
MMVINIAKAALFLCILLQQHAQVRPACNDDRMAGMAVSESQRFTLRGRGQRRNTVSSPERADQPALAIGDSMSHPSNNTGCQNKRALGPMFVKAHQQGEASCRALPVWLNISLQGCQPKVVKQKVCLGRCRSAFIPTIDERTHTPAHTQRIGRFCRWCAPDPNTIRERRVSISCPGKRRRLTYQETRKCICRPCKDVL